MTKFAQLIKSNAEGEEKSLPRTIEQLHALQGFSSRNDLSGAIRGAYLHVPFCFHKCHYCDFYSIVDRHDRQEAFARRLAAELAAAKPWITQPLETIFIGGGTPTLLRADLWRDVLLPAIHANLPLLHDAEFTVEANPETVTAELAAVLVHGGVNRISIGAQSFNPTHLKTLERWHDPANVARSTSILRDAGIENLNLDLIFAIPGQSLDDWQSDLDAALAVGPTHLSCYGLTYEPNTPMTAKLRAGRFARADEPLEADMFEAAIDRLAAAGFEHYEVSNWAMVGMQCRHNLLYWNNANWWPFGPSASGHVNGVRWKNVPRLGEYLDHGPWPRIVDAEQLDAAARVGEILMLRLRLRKGLDASELNELLRNDVAGRAMAIQRHLDQGLLERADGHVRLTAAGLMLADTVLGDLI